jgi:cysteine synthase A
MPLLRFDRFAQKLNLEAVIIGKFEDTLQTGRSLARTEGLLSGISSGAALWAVAQTAVRSENKTILVNSA